MAFSPDASDVYRTHVTKLVPSSGYNEPDLAEIRTLLAAYEAVMNAFTTNGGLIYQTMAAMNAAATTFSEPRSAWQFEAGSEGVYVLNPTTDTWTKVARLPYDFVIGTDTGAGTANAIQITTDIPVADGMIVAFSLFDATTASPVTVSINGGTALTLKTNRGSNASALSAGMEIWGRYRDSDSTFRMLNDQDVSALVAQAEAAAAAAEAALAAIDLPPVTANSMLVDNAAGTARETKTFAQVKGLLGLSDTLPAYADAAALLAASVSADTIFVGNVLMQANVSGDFEDSTGKAFAPALYITPSMFGAVGYTGAASGAVADSKAAIQAAFDYSGAHKIPCLMEGKNYNCSEQLIYVDDLNVYGYGATLFPTAWPASGGFLSIHPSDPLLRVVSGITISGLTISGELLPTPGSGDNTNLFDGARGVSRTVFRDCVAKKVRDGTGGGTGGGGFGMEQGAHDVFYINCSAEDCYRAIRVSGHAGNFADAAAESKGLTNNRFINFTAKRCGHVIIAHAAGDTSSWNTTNLSRFDAVFDGISVEDCGHYPWREFDFTTYPTIPAQKTGIFAFFGAQGVRIRNVRVKITSGYTASTDWLGRAGYPASGNYIGAGLSGNVGALAWGWCRDCSIENVTIDGTIDTYWMFHRAITAGDLGTTLPTNAATSLFGMRISGLDHVAGSTATVFDCESGVDNSKFSIRLEGIVVHAAPTTAIVGTNATALTNVMIEIGTRAGVKLKGRGSEYIATNVNLTTSQQDTHLVGGLSIGAGYGSVGVRDGWTNDGKVWRASAAATTTTTKMGFYNPNGLVGQIRLTTSGVDFVTTSDEALKDFLGEYDWREAFRIIKADPARDFTWKTSGEYAVGWGAQTSYSVSKDLASPGGYWVFDDGSDAPYGAEGAHYVPWGVDMSRRTPYLWAAVSRLIDQCEEMKSEIDKLKGIGE